MMMSQSEKIRKKTIFTTCTVHASKDTMKSASSKVPSGTSYLHQKEVKKILDDLLYSSKFFLDLLANAVQNNFIRCIQWSHDGRCVCVDKLQSEIEFNLYLNSAASGLECYNRLISRLQENHFQLTASDNRLPSQVVCYFHPSFNKATYHVNIQLLSSPAQPKIKPQTFIRQGPFYMPQHPFQCSNSQIFTKRNGNGQMQFGHFDIFPSQISRSASLYENVRFKATPVKPFPGHKGDCSGYGVKVVPLSFFNPSNTVVSSDLDEDENMETESSDESTENEVGPKTSNEDVAVQKSSDKKTESSLQCKILDFFFNPRQEKQNYVSSWLDSCCNFERTQANNIWRSAILMPSGAKKKLKNAKPTPQNNLVENSHLVNVFGHAYLNWKQIKNQKNRDNLFEPESSDFVRFDYSSLYNESVTRDILSASRDEKQIEAAVSSILD